jgi:pimeloyl-ACP methyl ester carboxylesterase
MPTQQANMVADFVEIEGKKLYYEVAGEGKPLVFLHSGFLDHRMWDDQWEEFSKHYRVVRYDMLGYGKSDAVDGPATRRNELYHLLNHLGIEAAYFVGVSMGGEIVLDFALEHPEMVLGVVAVATVPGGFEMQGEPPANLLALIEATQQGDVARASDLQIRLWIDGPFRQPDEVDARVRQRAVEMNQIPVQRFTWVIADMQPANPLSPPAAQRLSEIHAPTLIIAGALDDLEIVRAADVMAQEIADAHKVIIEGVAHTPNMEKPAEFNRIVADFLRSTGE